MISIVEIAPKVYRVDNGKGRSWTASLNTPAPRIENESGAAINPSGSLGVSMLGQAPRSSLPFRTTLLADSAY